MTMSEKGFEDAIEASLLASGYLVSKSSNFDRVRGLDLAELFAFIDATQPRSWEKLLARGYGGDEGQARKGFAKRLASEIDSRGTVDVLRHGMDDFGVQFSLAFFKPAHGLTPDLEALYVANRVSVTRQMFYETDNRNSLDLVLLVNGIPTATAELKNPLTNQTVEDAMEQYRSDRDPANVTLARRAIVHFAVDPDRVAMTTRLAGGDTRFLPFNQGSGGPGALGGAGNPVNPDGYRTSYLWERVWERDSWLDVLARFVHVEQPAKGSKAAKKKAAVTIFPRFHQWDAVRRLEADAKAAGAGHSYLVQHSAGSGKSNTIAWTCHRLSNLHSADDVKVFDKVIVITDRRILDSQLQDTIYQFEHARGVVVKVEKNSQQLADALVGEQAKIIVTTLQKFPFVLDKVKGLPARRYAVVIDEAHSSQTGESAKDLRAVLSEGQSDEDVLDGTEKAEAADEDARGDAEDEVVSVVGRGHQDNISFFAFTATPKAKTLEVFARKERTPEGDRYVPFHLYSMRQAIEEGFIHDVLKFYTTYDTYHRIGKKAPGDPEFNPSRAKSAIARFVELHPTMLAQKAEIIVEHFLKHTAPKVGGKAKAMVVTASRLHAVRYKQAIDTYIAENNCTGIAALVAFSGKVIEDGETFTEPGLNKFPESQTAEKFNTDEYQVLVVAEKFQTGFDQPLLHTMFVDKVLTGLNAVQTLSRLNRTHPDKTDTFVLDFRNSTEDIQKAFKPWFDRTEAIPTDPNLLWTNHRDLMSSPVIDEDEVEKVVKMLVSGTATNHPKVYALLDLAVERFGDLDDEDAVEFRDVLGRFISLYAFMSQVLPFTDATLERDYVYSRALQSRLGGQKGERIDLGSDVVLTHLRIEKKTSGSASLTEGDGGVAAFFSGKGKQHGSEPEPELLTSIVESLNKKFGTNLDERDQLLFDQFEETWVNDPEIVAQAKNNSYENFQLVFDRVFLTSIVDRMEGNEDIYQKILDDEEFQEKLKKMYTSVVYKRIRDQEP